MGRITVAVIVSLWVIPISILVNYIVPDPYMDEIFHVPQARQYCKANFTSWDPMITTPPGLYFLSLAYVASLFPGMLCIHPTSYFFDACSTAILRSTNGILAVLCSILVYEIITCLRPSIDERKATLHAVVLALYPLHWFFTFLYYTDVASLTAVLGMYYVCLKKYYLLSALLAVIAVFLRQTNIIWMLFVACIGVLDFIQCNPTAKVELYESDVSEHRDGQFATSASVNIGSKLRKRRSGIAVDTNNHFVRKSSSPFSRSDAGLLREIQGILLMSWSLKWKLLVSFSPFLVVFVAFVAFVFWNGGIVLGAKEAHTVSPHVAQMLYYSAVSTLFMAPVHFSMRQAAIFSRSFWRNKLRSVLLLFLAAMASFLSVHFFSIAHPYLLADNRHYPFYLWRKIIKAHWLMKYLLVPLYVYSWFSIFTILAKVEKKIWVLVYFLATAAVLIPAPLIEFRYYTIPFFFLVLHSHIKEDRNWRLMGLLYMVINVFTIYMFLFRPFHWAHEPGIQRFIW